jgi:hypothetical protein
MMNKDLGFKGDQVIQIQFKKQIGKMIIILKNT